MLALLKPWRTSNDLKSVDISWADTLEQFITNSPPIIRRILAGVQYYYDSKAACKLSSNDKEPEASSGPRRQEVFDDSMEGSFDVAEEPSSGCVITEQDLETFKRSQQSPREEAHANEAINVALSHGMFPMTVPLHAGNRISYHLAAGEDRLRLAHWQAAMKSMAASIHAPPHQLDGIQNHSASVCALETILHQGDAGDTTLIADFGVSGDTLDAAAPHDLLEEQRRAYDIIDMHLQGYLSGKGPPQLCMFIPGEAGVGKSKTVQTVTANFISRGVGAILVKGAYTGIAASAIDGQTLHFIAMIPLNGAKQSAQTIKALETYWHDKHYLIIDEISMVSREMFAKLSNIIGRAKAGQVFSSEQPFGGLNVILVGDFHQFPPVASGMSSPLYVPCNPSRDSALDMLGRKLYEQFDVVIRLTIQVRVTDQVWVNLLRHARHGECHEEDLNTLRGLVLTDPQCPLTDFSCPPWNEAVLVTPRHAVRMKWNSMTAQSKTRGLGLTLLTCPAFDTVEGRPLNLEEKVALATKPKRGSRNKRHEHGGLPDEVELALGMEVMVTFNVSTNLDMANGARGHIVDIVLDEREQAPGGRTHFMRLEYPPLYVLVAMNRTKATPLDGLEPGVLPIAPQSRSFTVASANGKRISISRQQLPITPAYAFTDYRAQAQTIEYCVVNIGTPPSGRLTPFNAYVALSRSRGRNNIRLLRNFDEGLFTRHPSEHLREEDIRLQKLDQATRLNWEVCQSK